MIVHKLERGKDVFLTIDLVYRAARKQGMDPMKPRITLADCKVDQTKIIFASGASVMWSELGLGELCRVDILFSEFIDRSAPFARDMIRELGKPEGPFMFSPGDAEWFFSKSAREQIFTTWGNQLAIGANSFVL